MTRPARHRRWWKPHPDDHGDSRIGYIKSSLASLTYTLYLKVQYMRIRGEILVSAEILVDGILRGVVRGWGRSDGLESVPVA